MGNLMASKKIILLAIATITLVAGCGQQPYYSTYATTSPIYISVDGSTVKSAEDAAYFIAWIDRLTAAAKSNADWNNDAEKTSVMSMLDSARKIYLDMQK